MRATIENPKRELDIAHRRERHFSEEFSAITYQNGGFKVPVTLRIYSTGAKDAACIWAQGGDVDCNGSGTGVFASEAAARAIRSAGIALSEEVTSDETIEKAVKAIAEALGFESVFVHHSHA